MENVRRIARYLQNREVKLPSGGVLTVRRFLQLGIILGLTSGAESLHFLLEEAFLDDGALAYAFLRGVEMHQPFDIHPLYFLLHEQIYCEGFAARWSANRILAEIGDGERVRYRAQVHGDI